MFAVNPSYGSTALGSGYLSISYNGPGMEHGPKGALHQTEPIRGPNMARNGARCHHSSRVQPNTGTDANPRHWRSGPSGGRKGTTVSYTDPDA